MDGSNLWFKSPILLLVSTHPARSSVSPSIASVEAGFSAGCWPPPPPDQRTAARAKLCPIPWPLGQEEKNQDHWSVKATLPGSIHGIIWEFVSGWILTVWLGLGIQVRLSGWKRLGIYAKDWPFLNCRDRHNQSCSYDPILPNLFPPEDTSSHLFAAGVDEIMHQETLRETKKLWIYKPYKL